MFFKLVIFKSTEVPITTKCRSTNYEQSPTVRSFSWLHHQAISSTSISAFYVLS